MTRKPVKAPDNGSKPAGTQAAARKHSEFEKFKHAHGLTAPSFPIGLTNDRVDSIQCAALHGGKGIIDVKCAFREEKVAEPALLLTYSIPPGASEGVHTHSRGDETEGSYDEFYYIVCGSGEMQIADKRIAVKDGDHIFVPNDVAHGIENTSENTILKVYLVAMMRE
jgi:mannose-6-phosphate isomerase-like protein (cupin superfamily)